MNQIPPCQLRLLQQPSDRHQQTGQYLSLPQTPMASPHPQLIAPAPAPAPAPERLPPPPGMKSSSGSDSATLACAGDARSTVTSVEKATSRFHHPGSIKTYSRATKLRRLRHCHITTSYQAKHYEPRFLRRLTRAAFTSYRCALCRDIFSREDILKRHFQKCSIRRGYPTGVSHLSYPQAPIKEGAAAPKVALGQKAIQQWLYSLDGVYE
ncbi:hypothetical protein BDP55DRAFT_720945 [Colletotrichum godetiae]|uniref:C2H2-type domain-containing protein n=1 Tax=Colletotrichum godetiae TaxID=1209918 RepID=A0AAJ0AAK4_9PEZI|nr:uncharacterized protein BDP55DRAFT_720945 [Colletotrichum godetiae]KAK1658057.1 hypothetical protein BDP55DRAFT_720945 [Colletotrichum godetiae]